MAIDVTDDSGLVELAAAGEDTAFAALVRTHTDTVWRFAMGMLRDRGAAEEAAQDTFLKAHRALASFRGEAAFRTWLLTICSRICIDRMRKSRPPSVPLHAAERTYSPLDRSDIRMAIDDALSALGTDQQQAFLLVSVLGFSRQEAAEIAGVPPSTMRSRVAAARGHMAAALSEAMGDER